MIFAEALEDTIRAGRLAEARGLTAYEGQTIYKRYMARDGITLDDDESLRLFDGLLNIYKATDYRCLLHEPELFDLETDRG